MRRIAITNQKGGVGKTTTCVNLGAAFAERGRRVLLLDLDPQAHLTTHLGLDGESRPGTYELLTENTPVESLLAPIGENLTVICSRMDLAAAETELVSVVGREVILRDRLAPLAGRFDVLLIDCPPSFSVLTLNAMCAVQELVVPLQAHFLGLQGVGRLLETVSLVSQRINPALRVTGFVLSMHEAGTKLAGEVVDDLRRFLEQARGNPVAWRDARIFETRIRRNIKLAECPSYGQSIFAYASRSNGADDYMALADELLRPAQAAIAAATDSPTPEVAVPPPAIPAETADASLAPAEVACTPTQIARTPAEFAHTQADPVSAVAQAATTNHARERGAEAAPPPGPNKRIPPPAVPAIAETPTVPPVTEPTTPRPSEEMLGSIPRPAPSVDERQPARAAG